MTNVEFENLDAELNKICDEYEEKISPDKECVFIVTARRVTGDDGIYSSLITLGDEKMLMTALFGAMFRDADIMKIMLDASQDVLAFLIENNFINSKAEIRMHSLKKFIEKNQK